MKFKTSSSFLFLLITIIYIDGFADERVVRIAGDPYPPWTEGAAGSKPTGGIAVEHRIVDVV